MTIEETSDQCLQTIACMHGTIETANKRLDEFITLGLWKFYRLRKRYGQALKEQETHAKKRVAKLKRKLEGLNEENGSLRALNELLVIDDAEFTLADVLKQELLLSSPKASHTLDFESIETEIILLESLLQKKIDLLQTSQDRSESYSHKVRSQKAMSTIHHSGTGTARRSSQASPTLSLSKSYREPLRTTSRNNILPSKRGITGNSESTRAFDINIDGMFSQTSELYFNKTPILHSEGMTGIQSSAFACLDLPSDNTTLTPAIKSSKVIMGSPALKSMAPDNLSVEDTPKPFDSPYPRDSIYMQNEYQASDTSLPVIQEEEELLLDLTCNDSRFFKTLMRSGHDYEDTPDSAEFYTSETEEEKHTGVGTERSPGGTQIQSPEMLSSAEPYSSTQDSCQTLINSSILPLSVTKLKESEAEDLPEALSPAATPIEEDVQDTMLDNIPEDNNSPFLIPIPESDCSSDEISRYLEGPLTRGKYLPWPKSQAAETVGLEQELLLPAFYPYSVKALSEPASAEALILPEFESNESAAMECQIWDDDPSGALKKHLEGLGLQP